MTYSSGHSVTVAVSYLYEIIYKSSVQKNDAAATVRSLYRQSLMSRAPRYWMLVAETSIESAVVLSPSNPTGRMG